VAGGWVAQTATPVVTPTEVPIDREDGTRTTAEWITLSGVEQG